MLVYDLRKIGNKLLAYRKKCGLTQAEVAELADLSDRTYADIERGTVNMRIETILRICEVLKITPDMIFTEKDIFSDLEQDKILEKLHSCSPKEKATAYKLLSVYLSSLT